MMRLPTNNYEPFNVYKELYRFFILITWYGVVYYAERIWAFLNISSASDAVSCLQ
jgi:hypothetical protein